MNRKKSLKKECRELQRIIDKSKGGKIIAWVIAGVFMLTTIGGGVFGFLQMSQVKKNNETISSLNDTVLGLESEKAELETENERISGEVEDLKTQIQTITVELQETEATAQVENTDDTFGDDDYYIQNDGYLQLDEDNTISLY